MRKEYLELLFGLAVGAFFTWMFACWFMQGKQYHCEDMINKNDQMLQKLNWCQESRYNCENSWKEQFKKGIK